MPGILKRLGSKESVWKAAFECLETWHEMFGLEMTVSFYIVEKSLKYGTHAAAAGFYKFFWEKLPFYPRGALSTEELLKFADYTILDAVSKNKALSEMANGCALPFII